MNTYPFAPHNRGRRPRRASVFAAYLLIVTLLLPGVGGWSVYAAPLAQEAPPERLPYGGLFDLPRLKEATTLQEAATASLAPEYASWSKLVFQSARNERDWEVYAARGDGSNQVNLSNHGSMDIHPRLNRGATRVVFASNRHGNYEIMAMNADGSGQARLTSNDRDDVSPAWSPDSSQIAFQSYRDGQPEIYVMNADGSNQRRLTNHGDYDGQPAWSPDGSQIAFVRQQSGQVRVWVMNADGSNQRQLSNQPTSENPAWSPDGSQIAYDSDGDDDDWQEIWLMDADGGNQRQVYEPGEYINTDAWVRTWSPDGRYVAFTRITFVQQGGDWYWTSAYLDAADPARPWETIRLSANGADWNPDWQSLDAQAPTSSVQALPPQSPGPFTVRWSGADAGVAGLASFDIQVRDGVNGAWADWQMRTTATTANYPGRGGRTYFFRSRARDHANNVEAWPAGHDAVTTVEALPPQTAVYPLPAYSRNGLLLRWGGEDPGGSGILSYDVQFREGDGAWSDWRMGVTETSAPFTGTPGSLYRFRARARDRAQNVEAWPGVADTSTTLHTWAITGQATDNRGAPVAGMGAWTAPPAFHIALSDGNGAYAAHVVSAAASYSVNWSKGSYGALPSTAFAPDLDAAVDVVLPPTDNVVQNWGFENGSASWQSAGTLPATITQTDRHSGASSAFMGRIAFSGGRHLLPSPTQPWRPILSLDAAGAAHVAWYDSESTSVGNVLYAYRAPNGNWSPVRNLTNSSDSFYGAVNLATDANGTAHLVWHGGPVNSVFYARRENDGSWSGTQAISQGAFPDVAVDASGVAHALWYHDHALRYAWRSPAGVWSAPQIVAAQIPYETESWLVASPTGELHAFWRTDYAGGYNIFAASRNTGGAWSTPQALLGSAFTGLEMDRPQVDGSGRVHVLLWGYDETGPGGSTLYYGKRSGGTWQVVQVPTSASVWRGNLAVHAGGAVHLAWNEMGPGLYYRTASPSGVWSPTESVVSAPAPGLLHDQMPTDLALDSRGQPHVAWRSSYPWGDIYVASRQADGTWSAPLNASQTGNDDDADLPALALDGHDVTHLIYFYHSSFGAVPDIQYVNSAAPTNDESLLTQVLTVPNTPAAETLSLLAQLHGAPGTGSDDLAVLVNGAPLPLTAGFRGSWTHFWSDLSPWANQQITLSLAVRQQAGRPSIWAYIDEVTIGSAHPDIWVSLPAQRAAQPGQAISYVMSYGNRGGVTVSNGRVTLQLPPQLTLVSADPPPTATTPTLRWDVGNLPGQSGPQTIRVTLQVAAPAVRGATLTTTASIASDTAELEQANNTAAGAVYVGSLVYLPLVMR